MNHRNSKILGFIVLGGTCPLAVIAGHAIETVTPDIDVQFLRGQATLQTMVHISLPGFPGLDTKIWCYEDELGLGEPHRQGDGSWLLLHHHPNGAVVKTHLVPKPGYVDWLITVEGPSPEAVLSVDSANGCWQFKEATRFCSDPDGHYAETFAHRAFLYTEAGFRLFGETQRSPDKRYCLDGEENNPPMVQKYNPVWAANRESAAATNWGVSEDRPVLSVIGVASRDSKLMAAWACEQSHSLSQGWHDCIHLNPDLLSAYDLTENRSTAQLRMYFMKFDPERLTERFEKDFPSALASIKPESPVAPEKGQNAAVPGLGIELLWSEAIGGWVGKYELTNQEYRSFRPGHNSRSLMGLSLNGNRQPVVAVSFDDAEAFCAWLNGREQLAGRLPEGFAYRLPTGSEFTGFATEGNDRAYPWGNDPAPQFGNYADESTRDVFPSWKTVPDYNDGHALTASVEQSGTMPNGLYGVGGNVWEWTRQSKNGARILRGGAWVTGGTEQAWWVQADSTEQMRMDYERFAVPSSFSSVAVGFRVVLAPEASIGAIH